MGPRRLSHEGTRAKGVWQCGHEEKVPVFLSHEHGFTSACVQVAEVGARPQRHVPVSVRRVSLEGLVPWAPLMSDG